MVVSLRIPKTKLTKEKYANACSIMPRCDSISWMTQACTRRCALAFSSASKIDMRGVGQRMRARWNLSGIRINPSYSIRTVSIKIGDSERRCLQPTRNAVSLAEMTVSAVVETAQRREGCAFSGVLAAYAPVDRQASWERFEILQHLSRSPREGFAAWTAREITM